MQHLGNATLIQKYNIPGPRYTSYPTVPFWDKEGINERHWEEKARQEICCPIDRVKVQRRRKIWWAPPDRCPYYLEHVINAE